ncbi:hypothetical protein [Sphingomonas radiodurans]|uniref:hypothetical protein n=1 Tax=Sphingomonas radiodurans TaxID=2890321 RepID=UPI001E623CDF|nr:hypothetical protein [Sphingomonas radiodurans]WBH17877.1 hypothetical protein LLW23_07205 [Sphingomonas radiodurans]
MSDRPTFRIWLVLAAQCAVGVGGLAALALAPPASGAMVLLPLGHSAPVARLARDGDALLLATTPGGKLIVMGERRALFWPLLRAGVLTVAAPARYCGGIT